MAMQSRFGKIRLHRRAIITGILADFGATVGASVLLSIVAVSTSADAESLGSALQSPLFVAARFLLGLGATVFGGYIAARMAPRIELTSALGVGIVMTALSLFGMVVLSAGRADLLDYLGLVLTLPAALIGGLVRLSQLEGPTAAR